REQQLEFTRSRAYHKNDQAWVEQKNGAVIRRLVGYERFMYEELLRYNRQDYNIYAGVNPRKLKGISGDDGVLLARCLFADFDGIPPGNGCGPSEFVLMRIEEAGLANPTLVISSGHGVHTYWRLSEPVQDLDKWKQLQERLICGLESDKSIKNPERIMRLPGFLNVKEEPHTESFIVYMDV
ncbi:MAG: hypothetical protein ACYS74_16400, partial [Planctomycetota bacterium]